MLLEGLFWVSACVIVYVYAGYPYIVRVLAHFKGKSVDRAPIRPTITIVIAAYNEERGIRAKLDNVTSLEYAPGLFDVVVISDASSDGTDAIVSAYDPSRVRLVRVEGRRGLEQQLAAMI